MFSIKQEKVDFDVTYKDVPLEEIQRRESLGYAHIRCDHASYFVDIKDESERERLQRRLGLDGYKWFKEETGHGHWVIYNPRHYKIDLDWENRAVLKLNTSEYDGGKLEPPINASSFCGIFSWMTIPENIKFSTRFSLRHIKEMSLMFAGSQIPEGIDLSPCMTTHHVETIRYMFYKATIPKDFKIGECFNTHKVTNMEHLFSQTKIPNGFQVNLRTDSLKKANHMFHKTNFVGDCIFGENFKLTEDIDTSNFFDEATIHGKQYFEDDKYDIKELMKELHP